MKRFSIKGKKQTPPKASNKTPNLPKTGGFTIKSNKREHNVAPIVSRPAPKPPKGD